MNFKTRLVLHLSLLLLTALPFTLLAQSSADTVPVQKISAHLALKYQLGETPANIRAQFVQNPLGLPADKNNRMLTLFDKAYQDELLLNDFETALSLQLQTQYAAEISRWLQKNETRQVTEVRLEAYTLQGKRKRVITMYEMEQEPPSAARTDLIAGLTDTTSQTESAVESSVIVLRSVIKVLSKLSTQQTFSGAQVDAIASNFRSQIEDQIEQQINEQQLIIYHALPDPVLEQYLAFWSSETGQQLNGAIHQSILSAFNAAADRFLKSVNTNQ